VRHQRADDEDGHHGQPDKAQASPARQADDEARNPGIEFMADRHRILGDHRCPAARQKHARKRDNEGGHLQIMDRHAHHPAEYRRHQQCNGESRERVEPRPGDQHGDQNTGEPDHRTNRKVDPTGKDHKGHAHGCNAQKRIVGEKIAQNAGREHAGELHYRQ